MHRPAIVVIAALALPAHAQLLYGNGEFDQAAGGRVIYHLDAATGESTQWAVIKKKGMKSITSMEVVRNALYVTSGSLVVKINVNTKHMRVVGRTNEYVWGGMAWDGETMWVTHNNSSLYSMDLNTGDVTFVKGLSGRLSGLSYNPIDGRVYAANDTTVSPGPGIYSFDPKNLNAGLKKLTNFPLGDNDVDSIAFDGVSKYYLVNEYNSTNPGTTPNGIYVYDTVTSQYSFLNTTYGPGVPTYTTLSGASYIPSPGSLAVLGLAVIAASRRRR